MIDTTSAVANSAVTGSAKSQQDLNKTYNDFLLLLTTQLKNQDPTSPMETNEFTQQLASLSSVQEQVTTNKNLETLISMISGSQLNNVVSYIGRVIEAEGNQSPLTSQGALFSYDLPFEAQSSTITILDEGGRAVYTGKALTAAGRNEVVWDGYNSFTGQQMPAGIYKFAITAKDSAGEPIEAITRTTGIVTAVDTADGDVSLSINDLKVPLDKVTAIRTAQELL